MSRKERGLLNQARMFEQRQARLRAMRARREAREQEAQRAQREQEASDAMPEQRAPAMGLAVLAEGDEEEDEEEEEPIAPPDERGSDAMGNFDGPPPPSPMVA